MKDKVTVIGSLNYDIIVKLPHMLAVGETLAADSAAFVSGGKGANQAVQCAKLGLPTYMVGCVGTDAMGDFLAQTAAGYGVHTDHLRRADGPSGMSTALSLPDGGVCAAIIRGANFAVTEDDIDRALPLLQESVVAVLQLELPLGVVAHAVRRCREAGCSVILNAAPAEPVDEDTLRACSLVAVNEIEAERYAGCAVSDVPAALRCVRETAARFGNDWVFTLGKAGAVCCAPGEEPAFIPSHKVKAVETTGAGDSFMGGLAYALVHGKALVDACRFATACSAVTVQGIGGQDSMPLLSQLPAQD